MKKFLIILVVLLQMACTAQNINKTDLIKSHLSEVTQKYAPDKRTALLSVDVSGSGDSIILTGKTNILKAKEELLKMCESVDAKIVDEIKILPSKELGEKTYAIINLSVANLRSKPDHPAELATQALLGTPVKVLEYDDSFYRVQTPDEYISWVDGDGIFRVTKTELDAWLKAEKVLYVNEFGFVYETPDNKSSRVSDVALGNILKLEGEENSYYKVSFPDGRVGYLEKDFAVSYGEWLKVIKPDEKDITSLAKTFMGMPYLWGGTSSKGIDCSGFTKTVYFMNGVVLPRDASQQVFTGNLIDTENGFDNLQPGDLLFFGRHASEDRKERITHVAIYLGDNNYIHASGRVKINSFDPSKNNYSEYRHKSFIRAKRILTSLNANGINTVDKNNYYMGNF